MSEESSIEPVIAEMHYKDGHMEIALEHPTVACIAYEMARLFKEGGGINYVAMTMVDKEDDTAYTVTIQPENGKPVFQVNAELMVAMKSLVEASEALMNDIDDWDGPGNIHVSSGMDKVKEIVGIIREKHPISAIATNTAP